MQIQIFQRNDSEYYDLRRRLVTYLMIVTIYLKEICLKAFVAGVLNNFCYAEFLRFYYIGSQQMKMTGSPWN